MVLRVGTPCAVEGCDGMYFEPDGVVIMQFRGMTCGHPVPDRAARARSGEPVVEDR